MITQALGRTVGVAAALVLGLGGWTTVPAQASTGWMIQHAPRPVLYNNSLAAVSCLPGGTCMAVGTYTVEEIPPGVRVPHPFAEKKTRTTSWTLEPVPLESYPSLSAVSCTSASFCVAVGSGDGSAGFYIPAAEMWNGTSWSPMFPPIPPSAQFGQLAGVSCASASFCMAVGTAGPPGGPYPGNTLAEMWNGSTWQIVPTDDGLDQAWLNSVSCPSPTSCTAVGYTGDFHDWRPLAETWNGSTWTMYTVPLPEHDSLGTLGIVSCPAANDCTAVGGGGYDERWNGIYWSVHTTLPHGISLSGISCPTVHSCTAVGSTTTGTTAPAAARWSAGTGWTTQTPPAPSWASSSGLDAVFCVSPVNCTAVGSGNPTGVKVGGRPLIEHEH
jgi:hypothetical protein